MSAAAAIRSPGWRTLSRSIPIAPVSPSYATTYQLKQGLFGARQAAEALAAQGHQILYYKPGISGTNQGGIDIVTSKDGIVYTIDNKAFTTGKPVYQVSALEGERYQENKQPIIEEFRDHAADPERSPYERSLMPTPPTS